MEVATVPGPVEPYGREGLPLSEARHRLLEDISPINALTTVLLQEALGRVNAKSINSSCLDPRIPSLDHGWVCLRATPSTDSRPAMGSARSISPWFSI